MAIASAVGIGSGLDISSIVSQLVAAERAPAQNRLNTLQTKAQTTLSALGQIKSSLSKFQTEFLKLQSSTAFQSRSTTVGDESLFTATATSSAVTANYSVEVMQLAQSHKIASGAFASDTTSIGSTGTLTIDFGTYDSGGNTFTANTNKTAVNIDITASNNSLTGIRDAINNAGAGVTASIINDGSGYRLVVSSDDSGTENSVRIQVADSDGNNTDTTGLSQLAYDPTAAVGSGKNLTETIAAQDAQVIIDGITVNSSSNTISSALSGVTLNLKQASPGTPTTLDVSQDADSAVDTVQGFVDAYNSFMTTVNNLIKYDADSNTAGPLIGDASIRGLVNRVQSTIGNVVPGLESAAYRFTGDIGIATQEDGTLALNETTLRDALANDAEAVSRIFSAGASTTDSLIRYGGSTTDTLTGDYAIDITSYTPAQAATSGLYTGAAVTGPFTITNNEDNFSLTVDGVASGVIALTQTTYATGADLAAEIQAQINADANLSGAGVSVTVSYNASNQLEIYSNSTGATSSVDITSVDPQTTATIGLAVGAGTVGTDAVALSVAGTIGGFAATFDGTYLVGTGDASGLKVEVLGGTTGNRGTISFSQGLVNELDSLSDVYLNSLDGLFKEREDSLNSQLDSIAKQKDDLDYRMEIYEDGLRKKFIAMDTLVGQMNSTMDYLSRQLASLPGVAKN